MQTLKSKIKSLMIMGVAAAEASGHQGAADRIKQEAESAMADVDALLSAGDRPTRHALTAVSDFRKGKAVAMVGDRLITWTPGVGPLMLAARDIEAQEMVELWPGEDSPDIQVMF